MEWACDKETGAREGMLTAAESRKCKSKTLRLRAQLDERKKAA